MVLNYVWIAFFVIAFIVAIIKVIITGDVSIFSTIVTSILNTCKVAVVDIGIPLSGMMIFFLGLMKIAENAGAINVLARIINPFMKRLFPEIPENHKSMGEMVMNFSANMLGLDNAATPFGLKAMKSLEEINPNKGTASNSQIMFLVLHTSGLTLIPLSIIGYRVAAKSAEPSSIFIPCVLATLSATLASVIIVGIKQRIQFDRVLLSWLGGILALIIGVLVFINNVSPTTKEIITNHSGNIIMLSLIVGIITGGFYKKINVFDSFIEGAKDGFDVVLKILPYLVGMLAAIAAFKECGALGFITDAIRVLVVACNIDPAFVDALPVAIMKPFSGSGARGLLVSIFENPALGPDSFAGKMASIFQGSADTTFYIIALYFGSVGIKNVRYAVWAGMMADIIGVIAAVIIAYMFFT